MRFICSLILLFLSAIVYSQEWKPFKSQEYSFRADFEGEPKIIVQDIPVDGNVFKMNMFYIENGIDTERSNLLYAVAHVSYNEDEFLIDDLERTELMLNNAVDGSVNNVKGKLIHKNDIDINGYLGKEIKIEMQSGYIYARIYLIKHELYYVQVMTNFDNEDNIYINKFYDSFDIIKVKE